MRTARTFFAGLLIPGLGFVLVNRIRLAVIAAALYFIPLMFFSFTRLILNPSGYYALVAIVIAAAAWSVVHATRIAHSTDDANLPVVNWRIAAIFASIILAIAFGTIWSRASNLGYETFSLPSNSMSPTLVAGDYILVDTWHFSDIDPRFGDMVVFGSPDSPETKYVKRVIGVPGDSIELRGNLLYRNDRMVEESYVLLTGVSPSRYQNLEKSMIGPNEYFVLGDNRDNSRDSRFFGPVPRENIKGLVVHLWYSSASEFPVTFR